MNFSPLSTPSSSPFCNSKSEEAKRMLDSNVMFAKCTPSNDVWYQERFANLRIVQDRCADVGRDFFKKDNVKIPRGYHRGVVWLVQRDVRRAFKLTRPLLVVRETRDLRASCLVTWLSGSRRYWCPQSVGWLEGGDSALACGCQRMSARMPPGTFAW
jgi:hypothetical protein